MIQARTERPAGTKALVLGLLLVAFMVLSLMLAAKHARASITFTVNNTVDPGNGTCSASGCSLREAITAANNTPGGDLIRFNILGGGVKTIEVSSPLPPISEAATIDGYTQPGASPNTLAKGTNAHIFIELEGSSAGAFADGLNIRASNTVIRGLAIAGFDGRGIEISGDGVYGVAISSASNNVVGGATSASANNIAFNGIGGAGVEISGEVSINNRLLSNSIFSHGDLGIDLRGSTQNARGTTKYDPRDADVGPNGLQNKPGLSSAVTSGGKTTIDGKLSTKPNRNFVVRFFSNPSGTDEGKTFIGQKKVTTTSEGKVSFTFSPPRKLGEGKAITATGTEGTSEFSAPRAVVAS